MSALDLSRWQFAITTVYHFLFVPITIGTSFLVAGMQTAWVRTGNEKWLRATKFFGKLFLINFAMGVVTGIVQEFQFGMNWSDYSRFVGDVFGAPLAMEGLLAFFLESTFLGLWIFGWDRLPKKLHLATIWLAASGTLLSAYFILAANSFMQNPVGYEYNPVTQRAEMNDIGAVLFQPLAMITFSHVITMAFMVAGLFVAGVSAWVLFKGRAEEVMRSTLKVGAVTAIVAFVGVGFTGDMQATKMVEIQPMKMAAAEALYDTAAPAPFSLFTIGTLDGSEEVFSLSIPHGLSLLATHSWDGEVQGINQLEEQYQEQFGDQFGLDSYKPNIPMAYWNFRIMMGAGFVGVLIAAWLLWATRKGRTPTSKWFPRIALLGIAMPLLGSSTGWIFTEMGRQPWVVFGLMPTAMGVSPTVSPLQVWISMIVFTLLYGALAVVEVGLIMRAVKIGPPDSVEHTYPDKVGEDRPLTVTY
ncbi:MAG: cytochrome ubiquinol oxidase subunit I [Candidatus Nanopelagicales bacterium]|jgi:cytochrome d ubiquinol oxidase subunit I|nr:cytochrome ubiquinol oxidase subunit I [Candidatus Nanopelagicales bacterium]MCU0299078.1 cytochrome ubiquinol oxidase subunit I [Candidatus Nanopelagicales bacterium]